MAEIQRVAVSLSFGGHDLDPDEISQALGKPTRAARKGEIVLTPAGKERVSHTGQWLLKGEDSLSGEVGSQIAALFSPLSHDFNIWRDLSGRFAGRIFVGLFLTGLNEGIGIGSQTLTAIGIRGLDLELDIYGGAAND
jgi:Domain of unknown function (DUF4279)